MIDKLETTCGCGQPTRYTSPCGKGYCNKRKRCPTYEELLEENKKNERYVWAL